MNNFLNNRFKRVQESTKKAFDFKTSPVATPTTEQQADINQKTAELRKAFTENNPQEALDLVNIISNNYFYQKDSIVARYSSNYETFADLQKAVAELKPANRFQISQWFAQKKKPNQEEEQALENFDIVFDSDTRASPDHLTRNDDREIGNKKHRFYILADGVSQGGEGYKAAEWFVNQVNIQMEELSKNKKLKNASAEDWKLAIEDMLSTLNTNAQSANLPKNATTTLNIVKLVETSGGKLQAVVVNIGDSIVLHKKQSGDEINLITRVDNEGISDLNNHLEKTISDTTERTNLLKAAETLLFKYPQTHTFGEIDDGFGEADLSPDEKKVLEIILDLEHPFYSKNYITNLNIKITKHNEDAEEYNKKETDPSKHITLYPLIISTENDYQKALRTLRQVGSLTQYLPLPSGITPTPYSSIIELSDGDKIISASDGIENVGYQRIGEILSEPELTDSVRNLIEFGQKTKTDDCTVQILEIKAKIPPVAPSSPDASLTADDLKIIGEIANHKFSINGTEVQPTPDEAKEIYLKIKNFKEFKTTDEKIDMAKIALSYSKYALLTSEFINDFTDLKDWLPDYKNNFFLK
jgi:serine/threonine protein phosphatase PrpC